MTEKGGFHRTQDYTYGHDGLLVILVGGAECAARCIFN